MTRTSASLRRKSVPPSKLSKLRKTSSILQCIEDGKKFIKTKAPTPTRMVYEPPTRPLPYNKKKKVTKKVALPVKPAKKSLPKKAAKMVKKRPMKAFKSGATVPSIFGGGFFGSSGTLTSGVTFVKGMSPEEIGKTVLPSGSKYRTSSRDLLPTSSYGYIDICFCLDATGSMSS
jgi:hypothetical protein